jgi:hypothetical protein
MPLGADQAQGAQGLQVDAGEHGQGDAGGEDRVGDAGADAFGDVERDRGAG